MIPMRTWGETVLLAIVLVAAATAPAQATSGHISVEATEKALPLGKNAGQVGVRWSATESAQVWIRETGKAEKLWSGETNGDTVWPYLYADTTTTFILRTKSGRDLAQASSTGRKPGRLKADRTRLVLPPGGTGEITLDWAAPGDAQVWVSHHGEPQKLFAQRSSGKSTISWITRGTTVFTLWSGTAQEHLIDTLVVHADGGDAPPPRPMSGTAVGFNYLPEHQNRYQAYLDTDVWPTVKDQVGRDLDQIASVGGTVTRVVLWPELSGYFTDFYGVAPDCATAPDRRWCGQARNLAELVGLARERGIKVVVTFANSYLTNPNWNRQRTKWAEFVVKSAEWQNVYVRAIEAATDNVLYYDLQNETSGVRGNQPNLQSAYVAMVYARSAVPMGKRGVSLMHASVDGAELARALVGKPMDFVDVHGYRNLELLDQAVQKARELFPGSTVVVGEIGASTVRSGEAEQVRYTRDALDTAARLNVPLVLAWELYDDPTTPPNVNNVAFGYLTGERAKPAFGVLCGQWGLVRDCGTVRERFSDVPASLESGATFAVRKQMITPNAIVAGDGTARLVITELAADGRELAVTATDPVLIGEQGLNYLRHRPTSLRLRAETTTVRIAVRAEESRRLVVSALTAGERDA